MDDFLELLYRNETSVSQHDYQWTIWDNATLFSSELVAQIFSRHFTAIYLIVTKVVKYNHRGNVFYVIQKIK
jgi:hypothetical protein